MIARRTCVLVLCAAAYGDDRAEVTEWLGKLAGYLTEGNTDDFLRSLSQELRAKLNSKIWALVRSAELASSIEVLSLSGEGNRRELEFDWYLDVRPHASSTAAVIRRERVALTLERSKKGWTVVALSPLKLFDPA